MRTQAENDGPRNLNHRVRVSLGSDLVHFGGITVDSGTVDVARVLKLGGLKQEEVCDCLRVLITFGSNGS